MIEAFQKIWPLVPSSVPSGFLPGLIHLLETVVDELDIEQVVHAYGTHLNIVELEECADHEGNVSSSGNSSST